MLIPVVLIKSQRKGSKLLCYYFARAFINSGSVSVFVPWFGFNVQQRVIAFQKCQSDLSVEEERKPQHGCRCFTVWGHKTPMLALCVPMWVKAARTEPAGTEWRQSRSDLQVLTEAWIVPSGIGPSKGPFIHTSPHCDYVNLQTSSSHLGSLSAPTRSHSLRWVHPAFLRLVWQRGHLGIRGQVEPEHWQARRGHANQTHSSPAFSLISWARGLHIPLYYHAVCVLTLTVSVSVHINKIMRQSKQR